jgi:hypothetical protein
MTDAAFHDRDRTEKEPNGRVLIALFVVAELLCFGAFAAWVVL